MDNTPGDKLGVWRDMRLADALVFQNYNILPRSGVRAESLRAGSENMPNFVTFWPTLWFKEDQEKIQVVTSLFTLKVRQV